MNIHYDNLDAVVEKVIIAFLKRTRSAVFIFANPVPIFGYR
jgi:hypothetical protein